MAKTRGDWLGAWKDSHALARLDAPAVDTVAIRAGLHAGSWAAACMVTPERIPGLPSPDAHRRGHRDRQLAGRADRCMDAPAIASLATGSRSMDPAGAQTGGTAAATFSLTGRSRPSGARRDDAHAGHPHAVVKPLRSISLLGSSGGDTTLLGRAQSTGLGIGSDRCCSFKPGVCARPCALWVVGTRCLRTSPADACIGLKGVARAR